MINKEIILENAIKAGSKKTIEDLNKILESFNIDDKIQEKKDMFKLKIWDKESDINGISAQTILDSKTYEIDQVYLVYVNNKLVYMQDHKPNVPGFIKMTTDEIEDIGNNFINEKAEQMALEEIYRLAIQEMMK